MGREGAVSQRDSLNGLSLSLPPQNPLNWNDKLILRVRAQPCMWLHLGPNPSPPWGASGLSPHLPGLSFHL